MVTAFSEKFGFTEADLPYVILPFCVEVAELAHNYTLEVAILVHNLAILLFPEIVNFVSGKLVTRLRVV